MEAKKRTLVRENQTSKRVLSYTKLSDNAYKLCKGTSGSAGFDLASASDGVVSKHGVALFYTDLQIVLPHGTYGQIAPRSGLALKNMISVGGGIVDSDYHGNVGVILFNHSDEDYFVWKGDRIAQLICVKISNPDAVECIEIPEQEQCGSRGAAGFGSTGLQSQHEIENCENEKERDLVIVNLEQTRQDGQDEKEEM